MESRALFREIHKNTWLKRILGDSRKTTVINTTKKYERYWVVFCVHDDSIAFLEGYSEPKMAPNHNPDWSISLQSTQHVSHALVPVENEFEFVITLMNEVVRFNAPSWDLMTEWVDTLRSKLREMKILSPKDNLYSKLPEVKPPLLPTRDPTSPLPAPPPLPPALVPGVERIFPSTSSQTRTTTTTIAAGSSNCTTVSTVNPMPSTSTLSSTSIAMSNTNVQNIMNLLSNPLEAYSSNQLSEIEETESETSTLPYLSPLNQCETIESQAIAQNFTRREVENINTNSNNGNNDSIESEPHSLHSVNLSQTDDEPTATNITIIQVSTPPGEKTSVFDFQTREVVDPESENYRSNVQIIPSNPLPSTETSKSSCTEIIIKAKTNVYKKPHKSKTQITGDKQQITTVQVSGVNSVTEYGQVFPANTTVVENHGPVTNVSITQDPIVSSLSSQPQHYEQVFLSTSAPLPSTSAEPSTSLASLRVASPPRPSKRPVEVQPNSATRLLTRGVTEVSITRPSRKDEIEPLRSRNNANGKNSGSSTKQPENQADKFRGENQEHRRRSSSTSDVNAGNRNRPTLSPVAIGNPETRRLQPAPQPYRSFDTTQQNGIRTQMTLREQQVKQLRREMTHPGGVRLQLRRKDCIGSIGWVDAFGGVWVAGWKQKEHPVLYNALHIGDQLLSIAGQPVTTAAEANKIIRACQGLFIEIIIRRIPFGRVYAIRREIDGQCLGLIRDGNTAVIVDVVPNSLAARFGLAPKAKTVDGLSLTFWVLTEINGRPLNLFFKETEIKDRLNSVGRDISILVQPSDLVTKLKKQLKSLRSYKDFIVQ